MTRKSLRLVGYVRVSKVGDREGDSFISPDLQRERIDGIAKAGGHKLVDTLEDLNVSGKTLLRPGIQQAFAMIEAGEADGIAVTRLDRFSRKVVDVHRGIERIEKAGGVFVAADLSIDTSTPTGKLMRNLMAMLAEFQLDTFTQVWHDSNASAMERDARSGPVPVGYAGPPKDENGRRIGPAKPYAVSEPDAQGVRDMFRLRADGVSWAKIRQHLDETTGHPWHIPSMRRMIENRTYLGELHRNGFSPRMNAHPALTDRVTFEAAQPKEPGTYHGRAGTLLGGLITCATCGHRMRHEAGGSRGPTAAKYRCAKNHATVTCPTGCAIGSTRAEEHVVREFLARYSDVAAASETRDPGTDEALETLEAAETELAAYQSSGLISVIGLEAFTEQVRQRQDEVDLARAALIEARAQQQVEAVGMKDIGKNWDSLTVQEQNLMLKSAITELVCVPAEKSGRNQGPVSDRLRIVWSDD